MLKIFARIVAYFPAMEMRPHTLHPHAVRLWQQELDQPRPWKRKTWVNNLLQRQKILLMLVLVIASPTWLSPFQWSQKKNQTLQKPFDIMVFHPTAEEKKLNQTNRWTSSSGDYISLSANVSPTYSSGLLQGNVQTSWKTLKHGL